jgi:hypothetical protein
MLDLVRKTLDFHSLENYDELYIVPEIGSPIIGQISNARPRYGKPHLCSTSPRDVESLTKAVEMRLGLVLADRGAPSRCSRLLSICLSIIFMIIMETNKRMDMAHADIVLSVDGHIKFNR